MCIIQSVTQLSIQYECRRWSKRPQLPTLLQRGWLRELSTPARRKHSSSLCQNLLSWRMPYPADTNGRDKWWEIFTETKNTCYNFGLFFVYPHTLHIFLLCTYKLSLCKWKTSPNPKRTSNSRIHTVRWVSSLFHQKKFKLCKFWRRGCIFHQKIQIVEILKERQYF